MTNNLYNSWRKKNHYLFGVRILFISIEIILVFFIMYDIYLIKFANMDHDVSYVKYKVSPPYPEIPSGGWKSIQEAEVAIRLAQKSKK